MIKVHNYFNILSRDLAILDIRNKKIILLYFLFSKEI